MSILHRFRKKKTLAEDAILSTPDEDTGEVYHVLFRDLWAEYPGFPHNLEPPEVWWRDRYHLFLRRGYRLLPRYHPEWNGSWWRTYDSNPLRTAETAGKNPHVYEDLIVVRSLSITSLVFQQPTILRCHPAGMYGLPCSPRAWRTAHRSFSSACIR